MQSQTARKAEDLSGDELELELVTMWSTITESAARWRSLRNEARQRVRQRASEALVEMIDRRLPPIKQKGMDDLIGQMRISKPKDQQSDEGDDAA